MVNKELEKKACEIFVCPNLSLIDQKGKELNLKDSTIKRAKDLAIEFFKKTYHKPPYSSAVFLLPSFLYIASVLEGERKFQIEVAAVFGTTSATINRWNKTIIKILGLKLVYDRKREFICPDLSQIDKIGKNLNLRVSTIEKAKELAVRYFRATYQNHHYTHIEYVFPALIYDASIINKDRRTQMDISMASNVSEAHISKYHRDILKTLGIKLIYGSDNNLISVSEGL